MHAHQPEEDGRHVEPSGQAQQEEQAYREESRGGNGCATWTTGCSHPAACGLIPMVTPTGRVHSRAMVKAAARVPASPRDRPQYPAIGLPQS